MLSPVWWHTDESRREMDRAASLAQSMLSRVRTGGKKSIAQTSTDVTTQHLVGTSGIVMRFTALVPGSSFMIRKLLLTVVGQVYRVGRLGKMSEELCLRYT